MLARRPAIRYYSPDVKIPVSPFVAVIASAFVLVILAAACGGGGNNSAFHPGHLTDPRDVATATPWPQGAAPEVVPIDPDSIKPLSAGATPAASPGSGTPSGEPGVCGETYTIKSGDTLFDIARKCGVSLDDLKTANPGLDPATLRIGQTIKMPPKGQ